VGEARTLKEVERRHRLRILEETGGDHAHAAEVLGIDRRTLHRKLLMSGHFCEINLFAGT